MKQLKALKEFFKGDKMLKVGDTLELDNEQAASLVKQGLAEYVGDLPPSDPMLTAHLEPEPEPLPPVPADPQPAPEKPEPHGKSAKHEPHKEHHK